ncbi:hypothetical protein T35B1_18528 [Salinisphaera shabanensis T35B1]
MTPGVFEAGYARFLDLHRTHTKREFLGFNDGLLDSWEAYKPRLRARALAALDLPTWDSASIGSGQILESMINAIELDGASADSYNNLVIWQNRFGHSNRDHFVLLDARDDAGLRHEVETLLFDLYLADGSESAIFTRLNELSVRRYPFVAYLFFLKDIERFTPIRQRAFAQAFRLFGLDPSPLDYCSWDNYCAFLNELHTLRPVIAEAADLETVSLIDAHSLCWALVGLIRMEAEGKLVPSGKNSGAVHSFSPIERSVFEVCRSVIQTVKQSNGQSVERKVKNKELRMSERELETLVHSLLDRQGHCCALTGLPFHFSSEEADTQRLPSPDRIDSDGHYEAGNLQLVCRFVNFWKSATPEGEFQRLMRLVQAGDEA